MASDTILVEWPQKVLVPLPPSNLLETDGEPLETPWHLAEICLLIEVVSCHLGEPKDYFVGGNMFLYFSAEQARNRDYCGPDFFFAKGVDGQKKRLYWAIWDEGGRYPNVIIELLSPSTAKEDRTTKKELYQTTFRTPEYFCYDPDSKTLEGWRLNQGSHYHPIEPNERGWLWSRELGCWLGNWEGTFLRLTEIWLRCFDEEGRLWLTSKEKEEKLTEQERTRAEAAEKELADLKARLAELEKSQ